MFAWQISQAKPTRQEQC